MALGRSLFTLFNFGLYQTAHAIFGVRPDQAYLLFKFAVTATTPLAVTACWILARDLSGSVRAATISALLVACSPILVIYGGQVMTDVPSVLFTAAALADSSSRPEASTAAIDFRRRSFARLRDEPPRDRRFLFALAVGRTVRRGIEIQPADDGDHCHVRRYLFLICPRSICALVWRLCDLSRRLVRLALLDTARGRQTSYCHRQPATIFYLFLFGLASNPDLVSVRQLERVADAGLIAFVDRRIGWPVGDSDAFSQLQYNHQLEIFFDRFTRAGAARGRLLSAHPGEEIWERTPRTCQCDYRDRVSGLFMGVLIQPKSNEYFNRLAQAKTYDAQLKLIPRDAVVISGAQTVAVQYWRGIGLGEWDWIGVGAGWPQGQLESKIDAHLRSGRRVFLDADPRWWLPVLVARQRDRGAC